MNYTENGLNEIYLMGLLHDTGKYIRKVERLNISHHLFSGLFILSNPTICLGLDVNKITNVVANHHDKLNTESLINSNGKTIFGNKTIDIKFLREIEENLKLDYKEEVSILKTADSLSASSDRASETGDEGNGKRYEFSPLLSVLNSIIKSENRYAIKHGMDYSCYKYEGNIDNEEFLKKNDKNYKENLKISYDNFFKDIKAVRTINDLDFLLKKYWQTVNANTWKPKGEDFCNTTTSLYDHSKTTAAIAACIYINKQNHFKDNNSIDIIHITINGENIYCEDVIEEIFNKYLLKNPNILTISNNEAYIMIPSSLSDSISNDLKNKNEDIYIDFGETIDFEIASNWKFKHCRDSLDSRITHKYIGILHTLDSKVSKDSLDKEYFNNKYKDKYVAGFSINGYHLMLDTLLKNNDSISKLTTFFRIFENFNTDVFQLFEKNNIDIISSNLDRCLYIVEESKIHDIEFEIYQLFRKYVSDISGITFYFNKFNKYDNTFFNVEKVLIQKSNSFDFKNIADSLIILNNKFFKINSYNLYKDFITKYDGIKKGLIHKTLDLYREILEFNEDKNFKHFISLSRFEYLKRNIQDSKELEFIDKCLSGIMYDKEINRISSRADIYLEALIQLTKTKEV